MESISTGKGDRVWGASKDGEVYYMDGIDGKWIQDKTALCKQISATEDGRVCCTSTENTVLVSEKLGEWLQVKGWSNIGWVGCANKGNMCATNTNNEIFCRDLEAEKVEKAKKAVADAKAAEVAKAIAKAKADEEKRAAEAARIAAEKKAEKERIAREKAAAIAKAAEEKRIAEQKAAAEAAKRAEAARIAAEKDAKNKAKAAAFAKAQKEAAIAKAAEEDAARKALEAKKAEEHRAALHLASVKKAEDAKIKFDAAKLKQDLIVRAIKTAATTVVKAQQLVETTKAAANKVKNTITKAGAWALDAVSSWWAGEKTLSTEAKAAYAEENATKQDEVKYKEIKLTAYNICMAKHKTEMQIAYRCGVFNGITYFCAGDRTCSRWNWCGQNGTGLVQFNWKAYMAVKNACIEKTK